MLGVLEGCSKTLFAESCGLENTDDAVMHVHKLDVSTPTSAQKRVKLISEVRKIRFSDGLFYHLGRKIAPSRESFF